MFALDDRAGNVVTTVAVFLAAAAILYLARDAFLILLSSLLFAYLLEPAVALVQRHLWQGPSNRTWAIGLVYLIGMLVLSTLGHEFAPRVWTQIKNLNAAVPAILDGLSSGKASAGWGSRHGISAAQQQRIQDLLVRHHDVVAQIFERTAASTAYAAERAVWLFAIPILAIFFLRDGRQWRDAMVEAIPTRRNRLLLKRVLEQVDTMLGKYLRAQSALASLAFAFYSVSMFLLGFPYAIALGILGGVLEFLPAVGWIVSALAILTIGFLTHAHWIWMALLLILWRLVQDYVNSPRIMGDNLQLQPLTVVVALMVGGQVGGIAGLYLSVPAIAAGRIVWLEICSNRNFEALAPAETKEQP